MLLVIPATNAIGERSFSALRRGKTYLSSTTGDSRLNHHMMLRVHKDGAANDFVGEIENNCSKIILRTIFKTSSLFRQSQHKRKIRDKNKSYCRQMWWSNTYQEKRFNRGTEAGVGGELTWATRSVPSSSHFMLATGLYTEWSWQNIKIF